MRKLLARLFVLAIVWGCGKDEDQCVYQPDVSGINIEFEFEQLHDSIVDVSSKDELVELLTRQPLIRDYIFRRTAYPDDAVFINTLYSRVTNPHFDTLLMETKKVFGDLSELKSQFREAFTNMKYYYPDFQPPKVQTLISGLDTDLFVSDTLIIVSLDFYLGKGAKYRPNMYAYLLRQYEKENIVPSCMLIYGISDRYNKTDLSDKTVLADMIAYGKSYYFAKHMLPCTPDSVLTWYTQEEVEGARENQDLIWARLIQDEVLHSTSHRVKQKYLGERPKTIEVGEKCPGRIGQWVGWQIVNAHMEKFPDKTMKGLMSTTNARKILEESNYRPLKYD